MFGNCKLAEYLFKRCFLFLRVYTIESYCGYLAISMNNVEAV